MNILLKDATVVNPQSAFHFQKIDIHIVEGTIVKIGPNIKVKADQTYTQKDLHVSVGWFDPFVSYGEPGYEERETLENGLRTAAFSGFTAIGLQPNTFPVIDNLASVVHLKNFSSSHAAEIHPIAAFTKGQEGKLLTEFFDLKSHGAIAFGDNEKAIEDTELLKTALLYAQRFEGLICSKPHSKYIGRSGVMHEGKMSTQLGLAGIPALNEELQIQRDLAVLKYTGGKLHFPCISSKGSVELIRKAKKEKLHVSCSVALANLCYTDKMLGDFDTDYKLFPPLRGEEDCEALKKGIMDGTIDLVTTHHQPLNTELKAVEFEQAAFGSIGLEAGFGVLNTLLPLEKIIALLTKSRRLFQLEEPTIVEGVKANLTLFSPNGSGRFSSENILSSSKNCAFINHPTEGKVWGTLLGEKASLL